MGFPYVYVAPFIFMLELYVIIVSMSIISSQYDAFKPTEALCILEGWRMVGENNEIMKVGKMDFPASGSRL